MTQSTHTPIGEAGRNVIANIEQLRRARGLSFRGLSDRLGTIGHPLITSAVHATVQGRRKVSVDDLVALAAALSVSPAELLMPGGGSEASGHASVSALWDLAVRIEGLLTAPDDPAPRERLARSVRLALRRVRLEVDELLANEKVGQ